METKIATYCRRLRLRKNIAEISGQVEAYSNQEYLLKILKQEVAHRETTRKNRLIKQADFYSLKTFDGYCVDKIRLPTELSVAELQEAAFVKQQKNLIFYSNVGTGMTHLATAIGIEACNRGMAVRLFRTATLVNQLGDVQKRAELNKLLKQLSRLTHFIAMNGAMFPWTRTIPSCCSR